MIVRRIHPGDLLEERRKELLAMTYAERLTRHKELLRKIYPGKVDVSTYDGLKVKIRKGLNEPI